METSDESRDGLRTDGNADSILEETVEGVVAETSTPQPDVDMVEEVVVENERLRLDTPDDVDSPRASLPPIKKDKLIRTKRKRSSSEDSSEQNPEDEAGPLSNVNKEINVGDDYQARIEEFNDHEAYMAGSDSEEILMWEAPDEKMDMTKLTEWAKEASERFLMSIESILFILKNNNFDYDKAYKVISTRPEIDEGWADEEIHIFDRCFSNFGKNFLSIAGGLQHRSVRSIIKHYYDSKKWIKLKQFANSKMNESKLDEYPVQIIPETLFQVMCENCAEIVCTMELVHPRSDRLVCRVCAMYYEKNGSSRPTTLCTTLIERIRFAIRCPDAFRGYMRDFDRMMSPSNGEMLMRRKMGKEQLVEDIVGELAYHSPRVTKKWKYRVGIVTNSDGTFTMSTLVDSKARLSTESPTPLIAIENGTSKQNGHKHPAKKLEYAAENLIVTGNGTSEEPPKPEEPSAIIAESPKEAKKDIPADIPSENPVVPNGSETIALSETMPVVSSVSNGSESSNTLKEGEPMETENASKTESSEEPPVSSDKSSTGESSEVIANGLESEENKEKDSEQTTPLVNKTVPKVNVWHRKKTLCMEEMEVLSNDSRRKMYDACQQASRVSIANVERMKQDMTNLRNRMERINFDLDLAPSFIFAEQDGSATEWTDDNKAEAFKCFRWYGPQFKEISQVMGHKSMAQICDFYYQHQESLDPIIAEFKKTMNHKVELYDEGVNATKAEAKTNA